MKLFCQSVTFYFEIEPFDIDRYQQTVIVNSCYVVGSGGSSVHVCVCVLFPSQGFAGVRLFIDCIFMGPVNILGLAFSFQYILQAWIHGQIMLKCKFIMEYFVLSISDDCKFC